MIKGHHIKKTIRLCLVALAVGASFALLANGLVRNFPALTDSATYQAAKENLYAIDFAKGLWLYCLIYPIIEELIFRVGAMKLTRKLLHQKIKDETGMRLLCILISALLFGLYHGNIVQGLYGFVAGILLGMLWIRSGSILPQICMHGIINLYGYLLETGKMANPRPDLFVQPSMTLTLVLIVAAYVIVSLKVVCEKPKTEEDKNPVV